MHFLEVTFESLQVLDIRSLDFLSSYLYCAITRFCPAPTTASGRY